MKPKPLLTLPAAAARLGISTNAARQAAQEGRLAARPVVDSGGAVVALAVEVADLAAFVPAVRGRRPKATKTDLQKLRASVVRQARRAGLETPQDACFDDGVKWSDLDEADLIGLKEALRQ